MLAPSMSHVVFGNEIKGNQNMGGECGTAGVLPFVVQVCGVREFRATVAAFRPTHVIVVSDPGQDGLLVPDDTRVLRLSFWDLDREIAPGDPMLTALSRRGAVRVPQPDDIQAIMDFACGITVNGRLLCCCGAGRSRSATAAVACPSAESRLVTTFGS